MPRLADPRLLVFCSFVAAVSGVLVACGTDTTVVKAGPQASPDAATEAGAGDDGEDGEDDAVPPPCFPVPASSVESTVARKSALSPLGDGASGFSPQHAAIDHKSRVLGSGFASSVLSGVAASRVFVVRLTPEGAFDATFGTEGMVLLDDARGPKTTAFYYAVQYDVAADSRDRALVLYDHHEGDQVGLTLTRLDEGGRVDTTYGDAGKVVLATSTDSVRAATIAVAGREAFVFASVRGAPADSTRIRGFHVDANGAIDPSFAFDWTAPERRGANGVHAAVYPDAIVVANDNVVTKIDRAGAVVDSFGQSGVVACDLYGFGALADGTLICGKWRIAPSGERRAMTFVTLPDQTGQHCKGQLVLASTNAAALVSADGTADRSRASDGVIEMPDRGSFIGSSSAFVVDPATATVTLFRNTGDFGMNVFRVHP